MALTWLKRLTTVVLTLLPQISLSKHVSFEAILTWETRSPDGIPTKQILVNGESPGPELRLRQGDSVKFTVHNLLPNASSIHFHGIDQIGTPWSDGVPGLSQRPIPSGGSFTYFWTAYQYGTYFYHGHFTSQISDGLYGAIFVEPSASQLHPFSKISTKHDAIVAMQKAASNPTIVMVSDWRHITAAELRQVEEASNMDFTCTNSILINGKGSEHCLGQEEYMKLVTPSVSALLKDSSLTDMGCFPPSALIQGPFKTDPSKVPPGLVSGCQASNGTTEVFNLSPGSEWASFNFISPASVTAPIVSIDEHPMYIYEVDGQYIEPQLVTGFQIYNGERYSAMVKLDKKPAKYTMRFANVGISQIIAGFATMAYAEADTSYESTPYFAYNGVNATPTALLLNTSMLPVFPQRTPPPESDVTHLLNIDRIERPWTWTMNKTIFQIADFSERPLLWYPNGTRANDRDVAIRTKNGSWVDLVFQITPSKAAPLQPPHPMHKHGSKVWIIGAGTGAFNWTDVNTAIKEAPHLFNLQTPPYRDSFTTPMVSDKPAWVVVRYHSANPGAWLVHCHIQQHMSGGMAMAILDGVDAWPEFPYGYGPQDPHNRISNINSAKFAQLTRQFRNVFQSPISRSASLYGDTFFGFLQIHWSSFLRLKELMP